MRFLSILVLVAVVSCSMARSPKELKIRVREATNGTCEEDKYKCEDSDQCIPKEWICDNIDDCPKVDDERDCKDNSTVCKDNEYQCEGTEKCIPNEWICDNIEDCPSVDDELDCHNSTDPTNSTSPCDYPEYQCADSTYCIAEDWICDGYKDCPLNDDEANCPNKNCSEIACPENPHICLNYTNICDGFNDCPSGVDESGCYATSTADYEESSSSPGYQNLCPHGLHSCPSNFTHCVFENQICDGVKDCPGGEDEHNEYCQDDGDKKVHFSFAGLQFEISKEGEIDMEKLSGLGHFIAELYNSIGCLFIKDFCEY